MSSNDEEFFPPEIIYRLDRKDYRENHRGRNLPEMFWTKPDPTKVTCGFMTRSRTQPSHPCQLPAGWGTTHPGEGYCKRHSGQGKWANKNAVLAMTEQLRMSGVYGDPIDIDPFQALLLEVQRTSGHVEWLRMWIQELGYDPDRPSGENPDRALSQWTPMGITPSVWLQLYQEERKHLVRVAKAAIDAGVAERTVRIAEEQARILAGIMKQFILHPEIGLTPKQRLKAPQVVRELIGKIGSMDMVGEGQIIEAEVVDEPEQ